MKSPHVQRTRIVPTTLAQVLSRGMAVGYYTEVPPGVPVERIRGGDVRCSVVGGWLLGLFRLRVRHPGNVKTQWFTKFVTVSEDLTHKVHHSHIHSS